jgi:4-amino-4-deoxy-L-arabinose transferase-like glycosyltransferase
VSSTAPALPAPTTPRLARAARLRARALVRGREDDPRWVRPVLVAVLALAAVLLLWGLTRNGYSNTYYAAAAKAGSESWKAWFFGSLDPGSFITVDKPPLSLWLMGLSARVLGYSSFSLLLPQALATIAAVGLLYATVRRSFGPAAGLAAAGALAITPVTVAIGRVNNPDALLVLLTVGAAALVMRALESGRTKHLVWCGVLVGLAFMTKLLAGWMIVPALAAVYLIAGPPRLGVRLRQLALAALAMVAVSAAWPLAVTLWPGSKPYIGGSSNGSVWNLIFGYDGFARITGNGGSVGQGASFGGLPGLWRMFNEQVGGQIAWLLPLATVSLVAGLWLTRRAPRTDRRRAGWVLFGVWAAVDVVVFSSQKGIFHPYYVSALAPAVAALAGAGLVTLWRAARRSLVALAVLDATLIGSASLAVALLGRTPDFAPALRWLIPLAAGVAVVASLRLRAPGLAGRRALAVAAVAAALALVAGPAAYSIATVGRTLNGNNVLAGPASIGQPGFGGGGGSFARRGGGGFAGADRGFAGARGGLPGAAPPGGLVGAPSQGQGFAGGPPSGSAAGRPGGGGMGGDAVSSQLINYLEANQGSAKYLVAAVGSHVTAPIIIATGKAVVTIGGFSGQDNAPTVAQLAKMVSSGELKYVLVSSGGGGPGGGSSSALTSWVKSHGKAVTGVTVSGGTLYLVSA